LQNIADLKPKVRYLVAVDDSKLTLKQIVKAISKQLSTGKVKAIPKEDAFLIKEISVSGLFSITGLWQFELGYLSLVLANRFRYDND
jgi:hypothetical protein